MVDEKFSTIVFLRQLIDLGYWRLLGHGEKSVLMVLTRYANTSGQAWPSLARLAAEAGVGRKPAQRAVNG